MSPVFLPEGFHGQRSVGGSSPLGCKESDTTERPTLPLSLVELKIAHSARQLSPHTATREKSSAAVNDPKGHKEDPVL